MRATTAWVEPLPYDAAEVFVGGEQGTGMIGEYAPTGGEGEREVQRRRCAQTPRWDPKGPHGTEAVPLPDGLFELPPEGADEGTLQQMRLQAILQQIRGGDGGAAPGTPAAPGPPAAPSPPAPRPTGPPGGGASASTPSLTALSALLSGKAAAAAPRPPAPAAAPAPRGPAPPATQPDAASLAALLSGARGAAPGGPPPRAPPAPPAPPAPLAPPAPPAPPPRRDDRRWGSPERAGPPRPPGPGRQASPPPRARGPPPPRQGGGTTSWNDDRDRNIYHRRAVQPSAVPCRFWPNCRGGDRCPFRHPAVNPAVPHDTGGAGGGGRGARK